METEFIKVGDLLTIAYLGEELKLEGQFSLGSGIFAAVGSPAFGLPVQELHSLGG